MDRENPQQLAQSMKTKSVTFEITKQPVSQLRRGLIVLLVKDPGIRGRPVQNFQGSPPSIAEIEAELVNNPVPGKSRKGDRS